MTEAQQVTLDGELVPVSAVAYRRGALSPAQLEIIRVLDRAGDNVITTLRAGRIVHEMRDPPCERCADPRGRCAFVAIDGREALERLAVRGVVRRITGGLWCRA